MIDTIANKALQIKVNSIGAELTSIKSMSDQFEYLWQGNSKYWAKQSPILFPIVGRLKEGRYIFDRKTYSMDIHGFAKHIEFKLIKKIDNKIIYKLESTSETLKIYPFKFILYISYQLIGEERRIIVSFEVKNVDAKTIYFSLGGHPGFNCPFEQFTEFSDYYIEFEKNEKLLTTLVVDGLVTDQKKVTLNNSKVLPLYYDLFINDALIFENLKSNSISIRSKKSNKHIKISFADFPNLLVWTKAPPINAPFICVEPWYGIADGINDYGDFRNKKGIISLGSKNIFKCEYSIEV